MKQTPLYEQHVALGARMVDYAGWSMPVQYQGIQEEALAVRTSCAVFDVSHMGQIVVSGKGSGIFLDWLLSRRIQGRAMDQCVYAILCYEDGGTVDDLMVYPFAQDDYLLVVNAANKDKDFAHIEQSLEIWRKGAGVDVAEQIEVIDHSDRYGQLALQGRDSRSILDKVMMQLAVPETFREIVLNLKRFRLAFLKIEKTVPLIVSRTGYTGEDGYEIYMPSMELISWWSAVLDQDVQPAGLGARDALRLEACLPLYGHELSAEISPLEAGLGRFVELERNFQGNQMSSPERKLIALLSATKRIPREGYPVLFNGEVCGVVSSGGFSPLLQKGIALAFVPCDLPEDASFEIEIHRKPQPFIHVDMPFTALETQ